MKRFLLFLLTAALVLSVACCAEAETSFVINGVTVKKGLVSHSEVSKTENGCQKKAGTRGHACCWTYAALAYNKIWAGQGTGAFSLDRGRYNMLSNVPLEERLLTAENLRKFFAQAVPGASLRISSNTETDNAAGHNMIFLQADSEGGWFYDGNHNGTGEELIAYYKWTNLCTYQGYKYIVYIFWPNAPKYQDEMETLGYRVLFPISAQFTNTVMRFSRKEPYDSSGSSSVILKNATVTVKQFVVNKHGNIWAQLDDGSFLCFHDQNANETRMTYVDSADAISVSSVQKPTGNLNVGQSFEMRGVLKTSVPILSVSAQVLNRSTKADALTRVTVKPNDVKLREFDINKSINGVNLNYSVKFNKLTAGTFIYRIAAQLGFEYNGKTFLFGAENAAIESTFTVGSSTGDPFPAKGSTMLEIARSQLGYQGSNTASNLTGANVGTKGKYTKYGQALGTNPCEWCAAFVFWCGRQAGVPTIRGTLYAAPGSITSNADQQDALVYFDLTERQRGLELFQTGIYKSRDSFTPDPGDLIFFLWDNSRDSASFSHVGIVSKVHEGRVYYIDGNGSDLTVSERSMPLTSHLIVCYCKVEGTYSIIRIPGDVNGNGTVNMDDVTRLQQYLANGAVDINRANADLNGDGRIDMEDVLLLMQLQAGWNVTLQ